MSEFPSTFSVVVNKTSSTTTEKDLGPATQKSEETFNQQIKDLKASNSQPAPRAEAAPVNTLGINQGSVALRDMLMSPKLKLAKKRYKKKEDSEKERHNQTWRKKKHQKDSQQKAKEDESKPELAHQEETKEENTQKA